MRGTSWAQPRYTPRTRRLSAYVSPYLQFDGKSLCAFPSSYEEVGRLIGFYSMLRNSAKVAKKPSARAMPWTGPSQALRWRCRPRRCRRVCRCRCRLRTRAPGYEPPTPVLGARRPATPASNHGTSSQSGGWLPQGPRTRPVMREPEPKWLRGLKSFQAEGLEPNGYGKHNSASGP